MHNKLDIRALERMPTTHSLTQRQTCDVIDRSVKIVSYQRSIHSRQRATDERSKALVCWKQISMKIFSSMGFWFLSRSCNIRHR